jgi:hypothetical protein
MGLAKNDMAILFVARPLVIGPDAVFSGTVVKISRPREDNRQER